MLSVAAPRVAFAWAHSEQSRSSRWLDEHARNPGHKWNLLKCIVRRVTYKD